MLGFMCLGVTGGHPTQPCLETAALSGEGSKAKRCSLREPGSLLEPLDPVVLLLLSSFTRGPHKLSFFP